MEPTIFLLNQNWTVIKPARICKLHQNWFQEVPEIFRFKPLFFSCRTTTRSWNLHYDSDCIGLPRAGTELELGTNNNIEF
jgi:hypothetical protein